MVPVLIAARLLSVLTIADLGDIEHRSPRCRSTDQILKLRDARQQRPLSDSTPGISDVGRSYPRPLRCLGQEFRAELFGLVIQTVSSPNCARHKDDLEQVDQTSPLNRLFHRPVILLTDST